MFTSLKPIKIDDPDLRDREVFAYCKQADEGVFQEGLKEQKVFKREQRGEGLNMVANGCGSYLSHLCRAWHPAVDKRTLENLILLFNLHINQSCIRITLSNL